ncbi:MAG: hypothetical protein B6243_06530 [Anaerolineaceae bacterium 4572_5.2]|nr:MAG: hypothetical protein B6243_06530 [Anaerolineaceae bacterium 4572_5.2]
MVSFIAGVVLLFLGILLGLELPDIDHQIPFLVHRSIVTHGFLIPLGVFLAIYKYRATPLRFFSMGFNLATVTHLGFDLFPQAWVGFSLIYIPVWGRTHKIFSWVWISLSIIICFYLTFVLMRNLWDMALASGSLGVTFGFYASTERTFWPVVIFLLLGMVLTLSLPSNGQAILHKTLKPADENDIFKHE